MGFPRRVAVLLIAAALAAPLGACGPGTSGPGTSGPGTSGPSGPGMPGPPGDDRPGRTTPSATARPPATAAPTVPPDGTPRTDLVLRRSGGLAGVAQTVVISAAGGWTFQDLRQGDVRRYGRLTAAQRERLLSLLDSPDLAKEAAVDRHPQKCADGVVYKLIADPLKITWSDCGDPGEPDTAATIVDLITLWIPLSGGRPAARRITRCQRGFRA